MIAWGQSWGLSRSEGHASLPTLPGPERRWTVQRSKLMRSRGSTRRLVGTTAGLAHPRARRWRTWAGRRRARRGAPGGGGAGCGKGGGEQRCALNPN